MTQILNYGGGRQTFALCLLIAQGKLPRPDCIVIADTGREKQSTWDYLEQQTRPLLAPLGLRVEIAPRALAYVDLYGHNGDLLMPVYTTTGKLSAYCSTEWKARVVRRYLKAQGITSGVNWIGFALDEARRVKPSKDDASAFSRTYPLIDRMLTKADCLRIIAEAGYPLPEPSSCFMCPNMGNAEWRHVRDAYPDQFAQACQIDEEVRSEDQARGNPGVWLHHSRQPLRTADLDAEDRAEPSRQCGLGVCFV